MIASLDTSGADAAGRVVAIRGGVVDVRFDGEVPRINDLLRAGDLALEVASLERADTVRCMALSPTRGLALDALVTATGGPITVPVTDAVLGLQNSLAEFAVRLPDFLSNRFGVADESGAVAFQIQDQFASFLQQLLVSLKSLLETIISGGPGLLLTGATAVISTTFQIFLILLAGAYFLYDFPRFVANFKRLVPVRYRSISDDLVHKADLAVGGYLRGQLVITMMLGVMIWVGLSLIGINSYDIGQAVFNLIPYLGPILGVVPAILLGFTVSPLAALLAALVFLVANQLEAHLLSPLILSRNTNLHPVTVMLAIMAGIGLMGLLGALLAVPLVALIKVVLEDYLFIRPAFTGVPRSLPSAERRQIGPRRKDDRF